MLLQNFNFDLRKKLCFVKADRVSVKQRFGGFSSISGLLERNKKFFNKLFCAWVCRSGVASFSTIDKTMKMLGAKAFGWFFEYFSFSWIIFFLKKPDQTMKLRRTNKVGKFEVKKVKNKGAVSKNVVRVAITPRSPEVFQVDRCFLRMSISTSSVVSRVSIGKPAPKIHQWTIYFCRWGFGWVDKAQCFQSARRFGAAGSSPDFSRGFSRHGAPRPLSWTFFQYFRLDVVNDKTLFRQALYVQHTIETTQQMRFNR